jgi:hypothetical protein
VILLGETTSESTLNAKGVLRYLHNLDQDSSASKANPGESENTESADRLKSDLVCEVD